MTINNSLTILLHPCIAHVKFRKNGNENFLMPVKNLCKPHLPPPPSSFGKVPILNHCALILDVVGRVHIRPTIIQALPTSSTSIYLRWKEPIQHPGGISYNIYIKKEMGDFSFYQNISAVTRHSDVTLDNLEPNTRYEICIGFVDEHRATRNNCGNIAVITTPAQIGKHH